MEKQISIIIPTYNMEKYIGKCLDSLLIPEFDQVEVLVVNDGSKDRSSEIAHEYADRYPNSIRVIDKENGNYGSCINVALPLCTGRYVKVLDADDTFDTDAFSEFVNLLPECDEDVVISHHSIVDEDGNISKTTKFTSRELEIKVDSIENAFNGILRKRTQMHRLAYNRSVFTRFLYVQTEGISYTDTQWAIIPLAYCRTVRYANICLYKYLFGREGQTMNPANLIKNLNNLFKTLLDSVQNYYVNCNCGCLEKKLMQQHLIDAHEYAYYQVLKNNSIETMKILREYELLLEKVCPEFYDIMGNVNWTLEVPFKFIEDIRRKNYPTPYKIPFLKRAQLSLILKLKSI